ncbi:MAG: hypothetical protein NC112_05820, partial [Oxalobacter formigenes]|nr:hypothetical protein [Oxalobacter formigenes]
MSEKIRFYSQSGLPSIGLSVSSSLGFSFSFLKCGKKQQATTKIIKATTISSEASPKIIFITHKNKIIVKRRMFSLSGFFHYIPKKSGKRKNITP